MDKGVQEEHVVKNSVANADRVTHVGVPVVETGKDLVSPSTGNSGFGLWRGHEVDSEFVGLLDIIMTKYLETFEHFTTTNKKLCTMKLNMLCSSVNVFTKISTTQVDTEMILEHRSVFSASQNLGFNTLIDDTKIELQDLHTLRAEKMQEIQKAYGTMGTNLLVGCIGDDLLSVP
ncbi:hypothetical protein POM88_052506 [Heracleum sosnowskyi]|uniref:Uncharacterized protein n=1 Tax=Heracleum sosnowskyi TaxID=360622 RepID=A0AAD8LY12_9APIA|nr:hypothetical protein POM88_052506 [Heracleum sosnowskyi]